MRTLILTIFFALACPIKNNMYEKIQKQIFDNEKSLIHAPLFDKEINVFYRFKKKVDFIKITQSNINNDTLYIVDVLDIEDETGIQKYYCVLWNSNVKITYNIKGKHKSNYLKTKDIILSKYKFDLISRWNVKQLEEESRINGIINGGFFLITRIIFENKKYNIETIYLNHFINFTKEF